MRSQFIKLTRRSDGQPLYLNIDHISGFAGYNLDNPSSDTMIFLPTDPPARVVEQVHEVADIIAAAIASVNEYYYVALYNANH